MTFFHLALLPGRDGVPGAAPYENYNGGTALRLFDPCTDETCEYTTPAQSTMQSERWYPTLETLQDGSIIIVSSHLALL